MKQMQDLLTINSPDNGLTHSLSDCDQLFIYETASTLIVSSSLESEVSGYDKERQNTACDKLIDRTPVDLTCGIR